MASNLPAVELWTDGACSGNPGPGGWAALLRRKVRLASPPAGVDPVAHYVAEIERLEARGLTVGAGRWRPTLEARAAQIVADPSQPVRVTVDRELCGGEPQTTNNRMEQSGLLLGLRALDRPAAVAVHIDSNYVMQAFTNGWLEGWKRRGWINSKKQPVPNRDLWEQLDAEVRRHCVTFVKVKGHAGVELNERVDRLAVAARDAAARSR